ncbi:MAG: TGS domain-containing protein [candidate division KSB1 bacterium]|nr:TGS domain-containing protein [candidate division KSB1 bacterium]MDZ7300625.1 TGS domain-containing protein [candidate division KSB1 bacterium]MDZ7309762.1 TGS domain-containing protein [candidate division KSB1 bacterium]
MPTNLPPECLEAEKRYREAKSTEEKIARLEDFLATIPKHKGTDKLRADYRRRLSQLKASSQKSKKAGRHESAFHIEKEGAGRAVLVGLPNVGKSALLAALTHATPQVSESPYSTWTPTPGMMPVEDVQIQLIDTPPLDQEHVEPELLDLIRSADLVLLVIDLQDNPIQQLEDTVAILHEHQILPRREKNQNAAQPHEAFLPFMVVVNKTDDENLEEDYQVFRELFAEEWSLVAVSAQTHRNFEQLKKVVFENLGIMRIYSKPPGKEPDLGTPFVLKKGSTVADLAAKVHKDFFEKFKTARVWGSGVYEGQMVSRDHVLQDGDVVELHI